MITILLLIIGAAGAWAAAGWPGVLAFACMAGLGWLLICALIPVKRGRSG